MAINTRTTEFLKESQKEQSKFFDLNREIKRTEGPEAKHMIESKLNKNKDVLEKLGYVFPNHPLTTTIETGTEFIALEYADGTISCQVREKNSNTKQIIFWGSKGPDGMLAQVYYVDNAVSGTQSVAYLTNSNQLVGETSRFNKQLGTYQIDLE